ncbi:MAG: Sec-independent protein translocase protein TatB [Cellvibrionaceae bacterium]
MFDIGFTEILVIATITLLVIGPERLPETVRTVSLWIGRFKRSLRETRREIEQHIGADDIRRELHNEEVMKSLEKIRTEVSSTLDEVDPDKELYPPGHHDHDPNNDIDDELGYLADSPSAKVAEQADPKSAAASSAKDSATSKEETQSTQETSRNSTAGKNQ